MTIISLLLNELESESLTTRKILSRVPADKFDWRPHPKSMELLNLARHIAELPTWITLTFTTDELDFATMPYAPAPIGSAEELMDLFEKSLVDGRTQLIESNAHLLEKPWTLRTGDVIHSVDLKVGVIRMALSQIIHHRAQLGVYLRLLDIPIPGSYGPSADEPTF